MYNRPGVRNEVTPVRNIIYLHVIDEKIKPEFLAKLKKYCEAFYLGMTVKIMYPTDAKTSKQFMEKYQIPSREGGKDTRQYLATNILKKTIPLVPNDAYCMLTITMQDLYPGDNWVYCFGWAMYKARTGVFSFLRFDP